MKVNKYIVYSIIFVLTLLLIIFYILGRIDRKCSFGDMKLVERINDTRYSYSVRIQYYDKIFRNSDIYGVYINKKKLPDNVIDISFTGYGSPFGKIVTSNEIKDGKIDNVYYYLKIKKEIYTLFAAIILILISITNIHLFDRFKDFIYNNYFIIFYMIIIFIYLIFLDRGLLVWDAINYISRGIDIFYKRELFEYPATIFSIITTVTTMFLFGNTQLSYLIIISLIPTVLTVVFSYKLLNKFIDKNISVSILLILFVILSFETSYILVQAYTDGWLLMFIVLSIYFILESKIFISAICMAIAYFFRSSLALPLGIFIPLLLEYNNSFKSLFSKKSIISYIKYYSVLIVSIILFQLVLNLFINSNNVEGSDYLVVFNISNLTLSNIMSAFLIVIKFFRDSTIPLFVFSIISLFLITKKNLNIELKKLSLIGIIYFMICTLATTRLVLLGYTPSKGENRYFIYPLLILSISSISLLYEYFKSKNIFLNIKTFLIVSLLLISIVKTMLLTDNITNFFTNIKSYDYSTDYPNIEDDASIAVMSIMAQGTLNYIFKNQKWGYEYIDFYKFYTNDNSKYKYLFYDSYIVQDENYIIEDEYGNKFQLIWQSKKGGKYTLYKNINN
ncbi:hypothetical protein A9X77_08840 [Brachyspira hyodysenteriae]|uniref:hypothetical protein n=1 Tax=Brachyspira hyodysenteriae TaxID=159 RepID=UPI00063D9D32|nr:hypothetical protein [Brachyspira hyodysenteriae]KLI27490.1 hypothetical protein SR30_01895 [Brachyspira hyodysenteriae]TVL76755.1 hypothetical protein A9X77_08840 [Brachyspira hyodysenteriae]TVL85606.1 hypothetical protein A9X78_02625 [Brachyspira hyodysenteriae]